MNEELTELLSLSMKITDSPAAMLVMPFSETAAENELELSSIFQPLTLIAAMPMFVSSNQSAPIGEFPLDQGATSVILTCALTGALLTTASNALARPNNNFDFM
jgi:hypothetical protein